MEKIKKFNQFINEAETSSYAPPKYLVSPALDPEGNQVPDDKLVKYMEEELAKSASYYKPGIRSANPPKNGQEVDRKLEDEMDESVNEKAIIDKYAKLKTRPFNKVRPGNVAIDYWDKMWFVIGVGKYSELEQFDQAGLSDGFENDDDCIAVQKWDDHRTTAVYSYGEEGARVYESINESGPTKGYIAVYRVMGQDFTVGPLATNNKKEVNDMLSKSIVGGYRLMDIVPAKDFNGVKKYGGLMLDEAFNVGEIGQEGDTFYLSIAGHKYGYQPKGMSMKDMIAKFTKIKKHSPGKALAWLKKNSNLVSGSKKKHESIMFEIFMCEINRNEITL